jgi:RNA polymerase sigma-70 factor (subfamily 1)
MPSPAEEWSGSVDRLRPLLKMRARQIQRHPRLRRRFDSSDLVQDALLRGWEKREQLRGCSEGELLAWLQRIMTNRAVDTIRREMAQGRDPRLEEYLASLEDSSQHWEAALTATQGSPGEQAQRQEELLRLAGALEQLAPDQGEVVLARDLLGESMDEIAQRLDRSRKAIAMLLQRGRQRLRELMANQENTP